MSLLKSIVAVIVAASFAVTSVFAQDEPTMSVVSLFEVTPSKEKQFDDAWMAIKEIAVENDYPYTEFVGGYRNERWIVTPIKNFADLDAVFEARNAISEAGGKKFDKAIAKFNDALMNSHTFFTKPDNELSYYPDGAPTGSFMEIDTFYYQYGKDKEMKEILAAYKALMEQKESPYAYQVNWDLIGSQGNSITIISYAESPVAMAETNAAMNAMLEGDDEASDLFARFLAISTGSNTMHSNFNMDATINMPEME